MRAITVNENVSFERGKEPKSSIGIGGFILNDEYKKIEEAAIRYRDFIQKNIVGKTIFVGKAVSLDFMTNTAITDVRFKADELYNIDVNGDIRLRGKLLSVNDEDLYILQNEQKVKGLPATLDILIEKEERIRILK